MQRRGSSVGCGLVGLALSGLVPARPPAKFQGGRIPFSAGLADSAVRRSGVGCGGGGAAWDAAWWAGMRRRATAGMRRRAASDAELGLGLEWEWTGFERRRRVRRRWSGGGFGGGGAMAAGGARSRFSEGGECGGCGRRGR
ncbi:hypothetical protein BDA96_04G138700 [Sorghum bicolor]|uniref:Uncharacterized protein n=1 Tax=Sorghum bicolor TaxID=4558 RepID=A0A921R418_SORBI|nr:hypothetical protein BDA96_04G138700 [Sorghum bicolor]